MPKLKKLHPIDKMKAIAWCHAVMSASGKTAQELARESFAKPGDAPRIEFPTYAKGGRSPSPETLEMVETKYPLNDLTDLFEIGPDFAPLWKLLSDTCPESFCMKIFDSWLLPFGINGPDAIDDSRMLAFPFAKKMELAWVKLVGNDIPVDFDDYDKGNTHNVVAYHAIAIENLSTEMNKLIESGYIIDAKTFSDYAKVVGENWDHLTASGKSFNEILISETLKKTEQEIMSVHDICAVIALRRIAEGRCEMRDKARYMFAGMIHYVPKAFRKWDIGQHLQQFLLEWKAPCSHRTIVLHDALIRKSHPHLKEYTHPSEVAAIAAFLDKRLPSQQKEASEKSE